MFTVNCLAQDQHLVDSLANELKKHKQDTTAANILYALSKAYIRGIGKLIRYEENNTANNLLHSPNHCVDLSSTLDRE